MRSASPHLTATAAATAANAHMHLDTISANPARKISRSRSSTASLQVSDFSPYSSTSTEPSFDQGALTESTLLTPSSSSGSPATQHRSVVEVAYFKQEAGIQQADQSNTPNSLFYSFDATSTSQLDKGLSHQPPMSEGPTYNLPTHTVQQLAHQESTPPTHPSPFYGHYSVSHVGTSNDTDFNQDQVAYPAYSAAFDANQTLRTSLPDESGAFSLPSLPAINPALYAPVFQPVPALHGRGETLLPVPGAVQKYFDKPELGRKRSRQAMSKNMPNGKLRTTPSFTLGQRGGDSATIFGPKLGSLAHDTFADGPEEPLVLSESAPPEDKRLFELRQQFRDSKGKGMWDGIMSEWEKTTGDDEKMTGGSKKARLQMKLHRAVTRHGVWPEQERERLRRAFDRFEEERYTVILGYMKEMGGGKIWDWKTQHIEAQLVREGLEFMEKEPTGRHRKRRYVTPRHSRAAGEPLRSTVQQSFPGRHGYGPGGFEVPQGHASYNSQPILPSPNLPSTTRPSQDGWMGALGPLAALSSEQEDQLTDQVFERRQPEMEDSPEPHSFVGGGSEGQSHINGTMLGGLTSVHTQRGMHG